MGVDLPLFDQNSSICTSHCTQLILGTAANLAVASLFAETGWVWNVTISTAEPKSLIESRSFLSEYVLFVNQELLVYCIFTKVIC
jgi:hypothetical protein